MGVPFIDGKTPVFLSGLADYLVLDDVGDEGKGVVQRLRHEASRARTLRTNLAQNTDTFVLARVKDAEKNGHRYPYVLSRRGRTGRIATTLWLTGQEAADLARQLDAPVDYFND